MRAFLWIAKALADESRLRILLLLNGGERCVCQLIAVIGLAPSTISKHMAVLHQAGLVQSRKQGRWVYYRLAGENADCTVRQALDWITGALAETPEALRDQADLERVCSVAPEELCQLQTQHGTSNPFVSASTTGNV